jgi:hypothetical protein
MRIWWRYWTRCLWRGHRVSAVTYQFVCGDPTSTLTVDECEACYQIFLSGGAA